VYTTYTIQTQNQFVMRQLVLAKKNGIGGANENVAAGYNVLCHYVLLKEILECTRKGKPTTGRKN